MTVFFLLSAVPVVGDELTGLPLASRNAPAEDSQLFQLQSPASSGLTFVPRWNPPAKHRDQLTNAFSGCGVAVGDFDQDGLPDVFVCDQQRGGGLFWNAGNLKFTDVSRLLQPVPAPGTWATGATWADVDNDGWLDLYVAGFDCPNRLYMNRGGKGGARKLVESAAAYGVDFSGASIVGTFADYDCDGDLDLYLVTNRLPAPESLRSEPFSLSRGPNGEPVLPEAFRQYADLIKLPGEQGYKKIDAGQYDHLFRNEGPGKPFTDVTAEAGMSGNFYGLSATWWDWNRDGWPDLYVANDFYGPDQLWTNNGKGADGKVTFTDATRTSLPHTPWFSMGSDISDINNDGMLDLLATDMGGSTHYNEKMQMGNMSGPDSDAWFLNHPVPPQYMRNAFYLNTGTSRFMEVAELLSFAKTDWTWSVNFGDLDNDGREDLFVTNGMSRDWLNSDLRAQSPSKDGWDTYYDFWYAQKPLNQTNRVFHNGGDLHFEERGKQWGLDANGVSFGSALADFDGDGDLDVIVNNFEAPASLYENHSTTGHQIKVALRGSSSNHFGLGATVTVKPTGSSEILTRYMTSARGFMSAPEPVLHFGLGNSDTIAELSVHWPGGAVQTFTNVKADRSLTITETSAATPEPQKTASDPWFTASNAVKGIRHTERPFDDFARQPLLPNKHSQLGPGIAFADVDGDGLQDFYLAQAAGTSGRIYFGKKATATDGPAFEVRTFAPFDQHTESEDIEPLFFDADGDSDMDLYVVSGGVEGEPGDAVFRDRLYMNDGKGTFTIAPEGALPAIASSGSCVAAADFDQDGDLDLYVGGRIVPGRYPETPQSQLLRNDSSGGRIRFTDIAKGFGLDSTGMVTDAEWGDMNGDGWLDLVVAHDWRMVKLFTGSEGKLNEAAMPMLTGWWNTITLADVDGNGTLDCIAGNTGLNTKYHASLEKPELLFYGDLDGTGKSQIVEAKFEGGICLPRRGYSCSSNAMPALRRKISTFHSFASKSLEAIYTESRLEKAKRYEANTLESGIFINQGSGTFAFSPLPRLAQAFPVFGMTAHDFTGDSFIDLYLIGNSNSPQRETGNMDGGISLLLEGKRDGTFEPVSPSISGLVVPGDAKGLAITDLNGDKRLDIVVTRNDGEIVAFERR
ncbi:MAG: VCBS repeat-containing protein [Verrucomicrobiae bacterium]|nr:VCBS repeat-containing protein [Verrucomicrobiae bacterium]